MHSQQRRPVLCHLESAALSCSIATKAPISVALDRNERYTRISLPKSRPILRVSPSFPRVRACARFPSVLCPSIRVSTPKGVEEEQGYRARARVLPSRPCKRTYGHVRPRVAQNAVGRRRRYVDFYRVAALMMP